MDPSAILVEEFCIREHKGDSHAICLCLMRVRKVHVLYYTSTTSSSKSTVMFSSVSGLGRLATAPALLERDELVEPCPALPMPRCALRRFDRLAYGRSPRLVDLPGVEQ